MGQEQLLSDADVFGTAPPPAPVAAAPLPNLPGYINDPDPNAPPGTAIPIGGPGPGHGVLSDADVFGGSTANPQGTPSFGLGFEKGLAEPYQNFWNKVSTSPFLKSLTDTIAAAVPEFEVIQDATSQLAPKIMADVSAKEARGYTPGPLGTVAGQVAGSALLPGGAATQGALAGVLNSNADSLGGMAKDAAIGAAGGKLADGALGAISRLVQPRVAPAVQTLIGEGVPLTIGQIQGGALKRVEDGLRSVPIVGDVIGNAQRRSLDGLNMAVANRALAPLGETVPAGVSAGRDAIAHAGDRLSDRYDALMPSLTVRSDPQFGQDLASIGSAASLLPAEHANLLGRVIGDHIVNKFDPATGTMSGGDLKDAETTLGQMIGRYGKSPMPADQNFADGLAMTRKSLRDLVARSNPEAAEELNKLNTGWANLAIGEKAAGTLGAEDGVFTPSQLAGAVKGANDTVRKRGYARGTALMQDLSDAALNVLPQRVPDSGTPFRHAIEAGVGAAVGKEAGFGHLVGQGSIVGGLMSLPYTQPGQVLFQQLLAGSRPAAAAPVARALDRIRGLARVPGAISAVDLLGSGSPGS